MREILLIAVIFAAFVRCDLNSSAGKGFGADGICWTFSNGRRIEE